MATQNRTPRVSVIIPSFNYQRFIEAAIASVLSQTMSDLELLIVDDGSTDRSPTIISQVSDARVRYKSLERNQGASQAVNIALRMATGRFIAICNADDEWQPHKLEHQLAILEAGRAVAVFSDVVWVDDHGVPLDGMRAPSFGGVFAQRNRSRWTWIRDLMERGNMLCHPSVLANRDAYNTVGEYDNRLPQLADLDMWIRMLLHYDIFVSSAKLVRFRLHQSNASAPRPDTSCRAINEHRLILRKTMSEISADDFFRAFGCIATSVDDELDIRIEKALYLLTHGGIYRSMFRQLGLELLYDIMGASAGLDRLSKKYGFDTLAFQREMAVHSPWFDAEAVRAEVEAVRAEVKALRVQAHAILNSTTWRATAGLRSLLSRLPPALRRNLQSLILRSQIAQPNTNPHTN